MAISAFELFKIGIGPSSSHTVGPMRAAGMFTETLAAEGLMPRVAGLRVELFGSLGATGHGHGSVKALVLGLTGEHPETVDPVAAEPLVARVRETGRLAMPGGREITFDPDSDIVLHRRKRLPFHSNAMLFAATDDQGERHCSNAPTTRSAVASSSARTSTARPGSRRMRRRCLTPSTPPRNCSATPRRRACPSAA